MRPVVSFFFDNNFAKLKFYLTINYNIKENSILKENHNSIDLTELEMLDDYNEFEYPRQPHTSIVQVILLFLLNRIFLITFSFLLFIIK